MYMLRYQQRVPGHDAHRSQEAAALAEGAQALLGQSGAACGWLSLPAPSPPSSSSSSSSLPFCLSSSFLLLLRFPRLLSSVSFSSRPPGQLPCQFQHEASSLLQTRNWETRNICPVRIMT